VVRSLVGGAAPRAARLEATERPPHRMAVPRIVKTWWRPWDTARAGGVGRSSHGLGYGGV